MRGNDQFNSRKSKVILWGMIFALFLVVVSCVSSSRIIREKHFSINYKSKVMALKRHSSFKVQAGEIKDLTEVVPVPGAFFVYNGLLYYCDKFGFHKFNEGEVVDPFCALEGTDIAGTAIIGGEKLIFFDSVFYNDAADFTPSIPLNQITVVLGGSLHITVSLYITVDEIADMEIRLMKDAAVAQTLGGRPSVKNKPVQFYFDFFEAYAIGEVITLEIASSKALNYTIHNCSTGIKSLK